MANHIRVTNTRLAMYIKPWDGAVDQDPLSSGQTPDWTGWTALGMQSKEGATLNVSAELEAEEVAEKLGAIERYIVGQEGQFQCGIKEVSVSELQYFNPTFAYTPSASAGTQPNVLTMGVDSTQEVPYYTFGFEGYTNNGTNKLIGWIPKVSAGDGLELNFKVGAGEVPLVLNMEHDARETFLCRLSEETSA